MIQEYLDTVTDEEIEKAFGQSIYPTNESYTKREILNDNLLKIACGFHTGSTIRYIAQNLGLLDNKFKFTNKGSYYLYTQYSALNKIK